MKIDIQSDKERGGELSILFREARKARVILGVEFEVRPVTIAIIDEDDMKANNYPAVLTEGMSADAIEELRDAVIDKVKSYKNRMALKK